MGSKREKSLYHLTKSGIIVLTSMSYGIWNHVEEIFLDKDHNFLSLIRPLRKKNGMKRVASFEKEMRQIEDQPGTIVIDPGDDFII